MWPLGAGGPIVSRYRQTWITLASVVTLSVALAGPAMAGGAKLSATLTGAAEVPPTDPDGSGTATLTVNVGRSEVCYDIVVRDITLPAIGAHIHVAPAGTNGPVVVALAPPDASGVSGGCVSADRELVKAILKSPEQYYVNVHTVDYPGGAVRGQLG